MKFGNWLKESVSDSGSSNPYNRLFSEGLRNRSRSPEINSLLIIAANYEYFALHRYGLLRLWSKKIIFKDSNNKKKETAWNWMASDTVQNSTLSIALFRCGVSTRLVLPLIEGYPEVRKCHSADYDLPILVTLKCNVSTWTRHSVTQNWGLRMPNSSWLIWFWSFAIVSTPVKTFAVIQLLDALHGRKLFKIGNLQMSCLVISYQLLVFYFCCKASPYTVVVVWRYLELILPLELPNFVLMIHRSSWLWRLYDFVFMR